MAKNKIILSDCDGVLVNWSASFSKFMTSRGHPPVPNTDHEYSLAIRHNISVLETNALIKEFNEGSWIAELDAFADSVKYVKALADKGFRFIVVTSISESPVAFHNRSVNLKALFGDVFDEINCIATGASKAHILMNWADTEYFWIEDHMRQAEAGHEAGLKTVLISHPYNSHYKTDLFPTVSFETPWEEIYNLVCKDYGV